MVKVNENIRFLRKKRGWTQEMFSKKIGIKRSLVGAYEEGRSDPRLNNLLKICDTFNISLDNILKKDVSILSERNYKSNENQKVKVLSITVDNSGDENIQLPKFQLPFLNFSGTHRAFEIKGDSMLPLTSGTIVIGKYIENLDYIKDGKNYILLTKNDGIVYKRVEVLENELKLISDNKSYEVYNIGINDIIEIWEGIAFFSLDFPNPNNDLNTLKSHINALYSDINDIKNKI